MTREVKLIADELKEKEGNSLAPIKFTLHHGGIPQEVHLLVVDCIGHGTTGNPMKRL
jgi:hypothetical protein